MLLMRSFLLCMLLVLCLIDANAQSKTYIGVKGGANFSSAYIERTIGNALVSTDYMLSYHTGVIVRHFSRQKKSSFLNAGLQTGINMVNKGWQQNFPTDEPTFSNRLTYLELPAEAFIYLGQRKTKPFFTLGFYVEHLIGVDKDPDPDINNIQPAEFYSYEEDRDRTFSYGIRVGVGILRDFGFGTLQVDGFGTFGFRDMLEYGTFDTGIPDLSNSYVLGFSIAYLVSFGKMDF